MFEPGAHVSVTGIGHGVKLGSEGRIVGVTANPETYIVRVRGALHPIPAVKLERVMRLNEGFWQRLSHISD